MTWTGPPISCPQKSYWSNILPPEESAQIPQVCGSLKEALESLDADREFLTKGDVFTNEFIDAYIDLKSAEEIKVRTFVHPLEYDLYYSV